MATNVGFNKSSPPGKVSGDRTSSSSESAPTGRSGADPNDVSKLDQARRQLEGEQQPQEADSGNGDISFEEARRQLETLGAGNGSGNNGDVIVGQANVRGGDSGGGGSKPDP